MAKYFFFTRRGRSLPLGCWHTQSIRSMSGKLTYKQSGVDTKEAAAFVSDISSHVKRTQKQRSLHQAFGLFAAAYDLSSYKEPVIVTGCDGVGTKTEILLNWTWWKPPAKTWWP